MLTLPCNQQLRTAAALHNRAAAPAARLSWVSKSHWINKKRCKALPDPAAAAVASAVTLAFLPWTGGSQGGFYDTGVQGSHGQGCQSLYQPAAAAEKRFAARLRQQQQPLVAKQSIGAGSVDGSASNDSISGGADSNSSPSKLQLPEDALVPGTQLLTAAEQLQQVPEASKDLVREILQEDNRTRTKQLVDEAWQSLE